MSLFSKTTSSRGREPIRLLARRHNYFPKKFMWRGKEYEVFAVEQAWTEMGRGRRGARHYFRVHCVEGTFDLYQDLSHDAWYLAKRVSRR